MRPSTPSLVHLAAHLRPCKIAVYPPLRGLSTLSRPKPHSLAPLTLGSALYQHPCFTRRRTVVTTSTSPGAPKTPQAPKASDHEPAAAAASGPAKQVVEEEDYHGPLTTTFRRLKILSLSSLTLTCALTPFIFVLETTSSVPVMGRFALAGIAMATSGVSTFLVAWCGRPYVTALRRLPDGPRAVEMTTLTLGLHRRVTTVFDTAFLVPTSRPFATWELAEAFKLPEADVAAARAEGLIPREETIAETRTRDGGLLGRWIVSWDGDGVGTCKEVGRVTR
uniref:Galactoside O-acetyltransferase LacA n=1 Tax=Ganoderma boninense TaxID=34458 RepID=A0A5K1JV07_9APHY|nr:Galactoside O-acetyltransferase LacA [Ganoderma boninense]